MAGSEFYDHTTYPSNGATGSASAMRSELDLIESGFGKLMGMSGNGNKIAKVNSGGTAYEASTISDNGTVVTIAAKTFIGTSADVTPDANWSGQVTATGAGYAGGLSLDATGLWVGHNSATRAIVFAINETEKVRIDTSGNLLLTTAALIGYGTGSGGTVTQATSKTTAVTLNKPTGQITTHDAAMAAGATVVFQVNNSLIGSADTVIPSISGSTSYRASTAVTSGAFYIILTNVSGGPLSEAVVVNFTVIKGSAS